MCAALTRSWLPQERLSLLATDLDSKETDFEKGVLHTQEQLKREEVLLVSSVLLALCVAAPGKYDAFEKSVLHHIAFECCSTKSWLTI